MAIQHYTSRGTNEHFNPSTAENKVPYANTRWVVKNQSTGIASSKRLTLSLQHSKTSLIIGNVFADFHLGSYLWPVPTISSSIGFVLLGSLSTAFAFRDCLSLQCSVLDCFCWLAQICSGVCHRTCTFILRSFTLLPVVLADKGNFLPCSLCSAFLLNTGLTDQGGVGRV